MGIKINLKKYRVFIAFLTFTFLSLIPSFLMASLIDVGYTTTSSEVVVTLTFSSSPKVQYYGRNENKTVHYFLMGDSAVSLSYLPVSSGPVEGIQIVPIEGQLNVFIYTLTPVNATYSISSSKLYIRFPISMSSKRMSTSFMNIKTDVFFKEMSDFFGLNVSLYDSAKNKDVSIKLSNASIEETIRSVLIATNLSYAYSANQVLYFGSSDDIMKNFGTFWQIYDGQVDVEKLKAVLGSGAYAAYSKDKSKLFVYGGVKEYRLLAEALVPNPKETWYYVPYTASDSEIEDYMGKLSQIYDIKYVIVPNLKKVAIYGTDLKQVEALIQSYKPVVKEEKVTYVFVKVNYPERVLDVFKVLYPEFDPKVIGSNIYVPSGYEKIVSTLSQDPTIGSPWSLVFEDVPENVVKDAIDYFGIQTKDYALKSADGRVFVTLFASEYLYKKFMQFVDLAGDRTEIVKVDDEFLKKYSVTVLQKFSDGSKIVSGRISKIERLKKDIEENVTTVALKSMPSDPPADVITRLLGYPTQISNGYILVTASKSDVNNVKTQIDQIRKNYGKELILTSDLYQAEAKSMTQQIYNVNIFESDGNIVIYGPNASDAKKFLDNFITTDDQVIEKVEKIEDSSRQMVESLFSVKVYNVGDSSYMVGKKQSITDASKYLQSLSSVSVDLTSVITQEHLDYIKQAFGVDTQYFQNLNKLVLTGVKEKVALAQKFVQSISVSYDITTVKLTGDLKKEDIDKFIKLAGLNIETEQIGDTLYLKGKKEDIDKAKSQIMNLLSPTEKKYAIFTYPEELDALIKSIFKVDTYKLSQGFMVLGTNEQLQSVSKFLPEVVETKEDTMVTFNSSLSQEQIDTIVTLFDPKVRVYKVDQRVYLVGKKDTIEKIKEEIMQFNPQSDYNFVDSKLLIDVNNKPLKEIVMDVSKIFSSEITIVGDIPDQVSARLLVSNFDELLEYLKPYGIDYEKKANTYKISKATSQQEVQQSITYVTLASTNTLNVDARGVELSELIYNASQLLDKNAILDILPETKVTIRLSNVDFDELLEYLKPYGIDYEKKANTYRISKSAIQQAQSYVTLNPNDTVNIDVKAMDLSDLLYQTSQLLGKNTILDNIPETKVTIRLSNVGFDELLEYLKPYGIDYEKKTNTYRISKSAIQQAQSYVTLNPNGNVNIDVKAMDLSDLLYQTSQLLSKNTILDNVPEMKVTLRLLDADFDGVLAAVSSYVSYEKRGSLYVITKKVEQPAVETQQATTVAIQPQTEQPISQKVSVVDKLISIKIEDERISDVIKEVFEKLGYSIIFQKPIDSKATMSVNNIDFDTFQSIIMNYGIVLKRSGNLYYVDITPEATKVITTYTFNVSRGADKVKELIEFYGGTALVNTDAGIIIAYNLDPKNVDEINKMIDRVSTVRVVSIETKIVDEALSSGFGYDMTTMLSSASSVVAGTDGLTLTLKVADMANLQNFLNSLVQNTEVSIKTTGSNVAIPSSTVGNSKLLASPNIMAKSGEDARIFIGDSIPIILTQKDSSGNTSQTLQILESGIELRITPYVNSDNTIDLDLYTSVGNFDYSVQVSGYPKTNKREATTKVTLKDGQTLVIGGLAREETSTSTWKVPILGDLPIIGNLFKGTKESTEQRNIIIFLTAKIIEN